MQTCSRDPQATQSFNVVNRSGMQVTRLQEVPPGELVAHALHDGHGTLVEHLVGVAQLPICAQQLPLARLPSVSQFFL